MNTIEQATQDVEYMVRGRDEISSREIRNEVIKDLEGNVPKAAHSWRIRERVQRMS